MKTYRIQNLSSAVVVEDGIQADGPEAALDVMARKQGYADFLDQCAQTDRPADVARADLEVVEVA